mgnify:CR=1 FL=1
MKGLFKRLSILTASLAMVFGVGLVNNEKNAKAAGESTYVKVTEAPTDWTGEYVLVYESSATSAYVWTGVDASSCYETTTITDSKITLAPTAKLNIASMTGGYSIKIIGGTNDGKYIGGTKNKNTIKFSNSSILNTIAYSSSAVAITSNSTTMKYNSASGQERFRYYKSGQSAVQLYKLDESSIDPNESKITLDLSSSMMKVEATLTLNAETSGTGTTITWESSDNKVATVADGVVTALKAGTTTITATFGTASASCKILVNPEHSGTSANDPLTIAEAKAAIDAGFTCDAYVKGIITAKTFNSSYKDYTVTVVDDTADTTNVFKFYGMKDIDGADFASDTLVVGETIIAYGSLIKYGSDYELNKGCYLVKKIENATAFIEEIDSHKKSIFEFWKYSNKDEIAVLPEGEAEEVNIIKKIEKTFDYEEDFEEFGKKMDKIQRKNLVKADEDSIFIATTNILRTLNKIKTSKITPVELERNLKEIKEEEKQEKDLSEKEYDIFGKVIEDNRKIKKISRTCLITNTKKSSVTHRLMPIRLSAVK